MNFYKDSINQTSTNVVIARDSCKPPSGTCSQSADVKRQAAAIDKQNNGHCYKT